MQIFLTEKEEWSSFENVVPKALLTAVAEKESMMFGAVEETSRQIMGVLVCGRRDAGVRIEWLYVSHKFRRQGCGAALINAAAEHLQAEGTVQFLDCIYSDRNVPEHLEEFLDGMLFEKTERPLPIWKFLSSSVHLPEEADRLIGRSGVFRLRELTYEQKKGVMKLLSGIDSLKPFDTQFSLVRMVHEEAEGVLLTRDVAGTLEISWLYARKNNPLTLLALLAELNMEIHNVYKDQEICLTAAAINDTSEQLIRKLVPDAERLYVKRAVCEL